MPTRWIGRRKTLHLTRILIEKNEVVIRTQCGLDPTVDGFTHIFAVPTCDECEASNADN